jgi:histone acetyltransferase (RNA polymerase elongator complex component)
VRAVTVPFFISHEGCPHSCVFCDQRTISGAQGGLPDRNGILATIETWQRSAAGRPLEAAFFGGSFTALPQQVQEGLLAPLQPLLANGTLSSVRISTRPDYIDSERVRWLASQGVATIEIGVQSMDDQVLEAAGRGHNASASEAAIRCVREQGLAVGAQLMPGLPGDTPEISLLSLQRVLAAGADFVRIYPVVVLAGTELARRYEAGHYQPLDLDNGIALCKVLLHTAMKAGVDVIRIGIQAGEGLNSETVLAGCWHPALGQLVRSELYYDLLALLVSGLPGDAPLTILCHPSRISDIVGQGKCNLNRLRRAQVEIEPDNTMLREEVAVVCRDRNFKGNIITSLQYDINEV